MLYKYFPESRFSFFFNPMLRFSPIKELNDPFECKSSFKYACSQELLDAYIQYKKSGESPFKTDKKKHFFQRSFPEEIFVEFDGLWDAQDIVASEQKIREMNEILAEKFGKKNDNQHYIDSIGVLSLSQNNNNPTMWAHYASNHTGFVIGFDTKHHFFDDDVEYEHEEVSPGEYASFPVAINKIAPTPVIYRDQWSEEYALSLGPLGSYWDFTDKKSSSWKYEEEWRVIVYDVQEYNDHGVLGLVNCPIEAIKSVYLGLSVSDRLKDVAKKFRQNNPSIEVSQAYLGVVVQT